MAVEARRTTERLPVADAVAPLVEARLDSLLDAEQARFADLDPDLGAPVATLLDHVRSGGKRLRPTFCHIAFTGAGGEPGDPMAVDAGAALELLHAFALLHDDVMDDAASRRGVATAHVSWEVRHRDGGWRGEARRFGEGVAVLVGDLAAVYADRLLGDAPAPARRLYDDLRVELMAGQFLDLLHTARGGVQAAVARRIAVLKSARYTVERPLQLGAALTGRLDELGEPLSAYGLPLGEAFQLRDDLLGAFGDPNLTGKPVGDDLREGKPTLLLALAGERATPGQAAVLGRAGTPGMGDDDVADLQEVLVATGARARVEDHVAALTAEAVAAAARLDLTAPARDDLVRLAEHLARRDR
jgi:geranylgeranyl diphosphate synthase type I